MSSEDTSVADIVNLVSDGDTVLLDTSRPRVVGNALAERNDFTDVAVYAFGVAYTDPAPLDVLARTDGITVYVSMVPPGVRQEMADGSVKFIPRTLYATSRRPAFDDRGGRTIAILQTPPVQHGEHNLGTLTAYGRALINTADEVVVEANPDVPTLPDGQCVPRDAIDSVVSVDEPVPVLRGAEPTDVERDIAENVATLVPTGATIQIGIGKVYPVIAEKLTERDCTVWTGLISNGVEALADDPTVDSITGCSALGMDTSFYRWLREEAPEKVQLTSVTNTHNPSRLKDQRRFVAINSAFQVDLAGQVNAEMINRKQLSGVGGQIDFMHAAAAAPEGCSVIALPSRSSNNHSTIIPSVGGDAVVTTPRHCVDAVVTEHGIARLRNRSTGDRARALISVAHPEDRADLERRAKRSNLL